MGELALVELSHARVLGDLLQHAGLRIGEGDRTRQSRGRQGDDAAASDARRERAGSAIPRATL